MTANAKQAASSGEYLTPFLAQVENPADAIDSYEQKFRTTLISLKQVALKDKFSSTGQGVLNPVLLAHHNTTMMIIGEGLPKSDETGHSESSDSVSKWSKVKTSTKKSNLAMNKLSNFVYIKVLEADCGKPNIDNEALAIFAYGAREMVKTHSVEQVIEMAKEWLPNQFKDSAEKEKIDHEVVRARKKIASNATGTWHDR
jgi:hypothetical protein